MIDFTNCALSYVRYGGSERKIGVVYNDSLYMLKFQKKTAFGRRNNHISEYIGSHIYQLLGIDVHETELGTYKGEYVVACKDFTSEHLFFVPFNEVGESTIETDIEHYQYNYDEILYLIGQNSKIADPGAAVEFFFRMFIVDALIGNFDRHGANWGFIKNGNYRLAPVFDNGSCLFPQMVDEDEMRAIMNSEYEMNERVYKYPTSQIKLDGKKSSYFEVISSLRYAECNNQLKWVVERLSLDQITEMINSIEIISDAQKRFYIEVIKNRYEKILLFSYNKLMGVNQDE